jgi:hypothetical protein
MPIIQRVSVKYVGVFARFECYTVEIEVNFDPAHAMTLLRFGAFSLAFELLTTVKFPSVEKKVYLSVFNSLKLKSDARLIREVAGEVLIKIAHPIGCFNDQKTQKQLQI